MVKHLKIADIKSDPVAKRLITNSENRNDSVEAQRLAMHWLAGQVQRSRMRRRAWVCVMMAWSTIAIAAVASAATAYMMANNIAAIFDSNSASLNNFHDPYANPHPLPDRGFSNVVPGLLLAIAIMVLAAGAITLLRRRLPGIQSVIDSLDWATGCDAVARLLHQGCTYSESFSLTAGILRDGIVRDWFAEFAARTNRGQPFFASQQLIEGDAAMLRLLVSSDEHTEVPASSLPERWTTAANHFESVSQRRLGIMTHFIPPAATLMSGLLVWIALSASLGWMWRAMGSTLGGFR
ncbi:hypothetical protein Pla22_39740 [Rubripirellula amarantea]|uniref:Uncharacterized protein n=1 Tax=Rubripirellula amarantea TaxID=2527999 RepID=A0A5C5WKQ1_9BACT|nr:hypothetical protein [Rubripirellula amarantea]TWT51197.1 hypothetical protein Pla22_39740 [Rubripirellula amarantea]